MSASNECRRIRERLLQLKASGRNKSAEFFDDESSSSWEIVDRVKSRIFSRELTYHVAAPKLGIYNPVWSC